MPSHPHPPHTQSDRCLLVVTCSILQPFSCFRDHSKDASPHGSGPKFPHPPYSCVLPHFSTFSQAYSGQDTWIALTAYLNKHIPTATAMPKPSTLAHGLFWLCFTSGPLPTPRLCTPVPEQTPEAGSSCFEQPAQTVLLQGSNLKWQMQDCLPATGQLELGKLDKAVVHSLEGRQGYVGWDISSSLKHRWEQPPFSEVSPQVKEVNTALWDKLSLGLPGSLPRTSTYPRLHSSQIQGEGGCLVSDNPQLTLMSHGPVSWWSHPLLSHTK